MRRVVTRLALLAALLALALPTAPAQALLCTPLLGCSCTVDASDLSFGAIQPLAAAATTSASDVTVSCSGVIDAAPLVFVKIGAGQSGAFADRQMRSGANVLHYNIYDSTAYTTILGDGSGAYPQLVVSGGLVVLGGWSETAHLYGRVPAAPATQPGAYSDTITVRIDW